MARNTSHSTPLSDPLKTYCLFRCTEYQYAELLRKQGTIKFNTPAKWIELEQTEGKGRGDSQEGIFAHLSFNDYDSIANCQTLRSNIKGKTEYQMSSLRSDSILQLPCFCLFGLHNTLFSEIMVDKEMIQHYTYTVRKNYFNDFSNQITKETLHLIPESEKPVLVIITNPLEFINRIKNQLIKLGFSEDEILMFPVKYIDKNCSFIITEKFPGELFYKDNSFSYQNEVRIVINSKNKEALKKLVSNDYLIHIGNLEDIISIEDFYFDDMFLEIQDNTLLYALSKEKHHHLSQLPKEELLFILHRLKEIYEKNTTNISSELILNQINTIKAIVEK